MNHDELLQHHRVHLDPISLELVREENPVSASRSATNTVFHHCDVYQGRPSYCSCLNIMELIMGGRDNLRPECKQAISEGKCPAVDMRKAELAAGRALFYVDYQKLSARRKVQAEIDRESSPVQFRRKKREGIPLQTIRVVGEPQIKTPEVAPSKDDYNTNIMEQVVKKVLDNDNITSAESDAD